MAIVRLKSKYRTRTPKCQITPILRNAFARVSGFTNPLLSVDLLRKRQVIDYVHDTKAFNPCDRPQPTYNREL